MRDKRKNRIGKIITVAGLAFLAAAVLLLAYNLWDSQRAQQSQEEILAEYLEENKNASEEPENTEKDMLLSQDLPDYILNPDMDMPEVTLSSLGGATCIGTLEIPSLDLTLPVMSEWSYPLLKLAPCRYAGSVYQGNLVIAAHNYKTHFRKIRTLSEGSEVRFTDAAGNVFVYHVAVVEALTAQSVEEMISGGWPLSLFTCTADGKNRVTVRCE